MIENYIKLSLEDPLEKECLPTPVLLPREFHGQRSLAGCSSWGRKQSGMTVSQTLSLSSGSSCSFVTCLCHCIRVYNVNLLPSVLNSPASPQRESMLSLFFCMLSEVFYSKTNTIVFSHLLKNTVGSILSQIFSQVLEIQLTYSSV